MKRLNLFLINIPMRLDRDIPARQAGAARGQDHIHIRPVAPVAQLRRDHRPVVLHDPPRGQHMPRFGQPLG